MALLDAEAKQSRKINAEIRKSVFHILLIAPVFLTMRPSSIKEALRKKFAKAANDFEHQLRAISSEISSMVGSLEVPFNHHQCPYRSSRVPHAEARVIRLFDRASKIKLTRYNESSRHYQVRLTK